MRGLARAQGAGEGGYSFKRSASFKRARAATTDCCEPATSFASLQWDSGVHVHHHLRTGAGPPPAPAGAGVAAAGDGAADAAVVLAHGEAEPLFFQPLDSPAAPVEDGVALRLTAGAGFEAPPEAAAPDRQQPKEQRAGGLFSCQTCTRQPLGGHCGTCSSGGVKRAREPDAPAPPPPAGAFHLAPPAPAPPAE